MNYFDYLINFLKDTWGITDSEVIDFLRRHFANVIESGYNPKDHDHYDKEPVQQKANWNMWVGMIENQLNKPRCVFQSLEVSSRVRTNRKRGIDFNQGSSMVDYDAQALYDYCKTIDGFPDQPGTTLRNGMDCVKNKGFTELRPYAGQIYQCNEHWICKNRKETLNDLYTIGPVEIVCKWYLSFFTGKGVLIPTSKDVFVGLHALPLTKRDELDDQQGATEGINSYGESWGMYGHFILPDNQWNDLVIEARCCK